uniref:Uncharacterized protein n=1 Tax=Arundo donax TaxID=35708 RepID=A0A0A8ZTI5_ARUDO
MVNQQLLFLLSLSRKEDGNYNQCYCTKPLKHIFHMMLSAVLQVLKLTSTKCFQSGDASSLTTRNRRVAEISETISTKKRTANSHALVSEAATLLFSEER